MSRVAAVSIWIVFAFFAPASAQVCPEHTGHWGYGPTNVVAIGGDLVLMDSGPKLLVASLHPITNPSLVGELPLPAEVRSIAISGDTAYLAVAYRIGNPQSFWTVDLSDPAQPAFLGSLEVPQYLTDVAVQGNIAYLSSLYFGLTVVDVSDPTNPEILSELDRWGLYDALGVSGSYAYLVEETRLSVVDVSNPRRPFFTAHLDLSSGIDIAVVSAHAYVLGRDDLQVFDITNGADPQRRGAIAGFQVPGAVDAVDNIVFVSDGRDDPRLVVIDAGNPEAPAVIAEYRPGTLLGDVAATAGAVVLGLHAAGSQLVDTTDPSAPAFLAAFPPPAPAGVIVDVAAKDGYAFLADAGFNDGAPPTVGRVRVIDLSRGPNYTEVASLDLASAANNVALFGDHLVVTSGEDYGPPLALDVIDISNPTSPTVAGGLELFGDPSYQIEVSGDHAFIANRWLHIVDLADPTQPVIASQTHTSGGGFISIAVAGDRAYTANSWNGLCVLDVSDPSDPVEIGCTPTADRARWVAVADGRAYVTANFDRPTQGLDDLLLSFDITGDGAPVQIGSFPLWGQAGRMSVSGRLAFVDAGARGLLVIDIEDPGVPVLAGVAPRNGIGIALDDRLFGPVRERGLDVLSVATCEFPLPLADFRWQPTDPILGEEVGFTDASAGSPTTWSWDFGDGATSQLRHPSHTFMVPGDRTVSLTVGNPTGSHIVHRQVRVQSIAEPRRYSRLIPAVAHGAGKNDTQWRSDVVIDTGHLVNSSAVAFFMKRRQDNSRQFGKRIELPGGSARLDDVVATLFDESETSGAILFTSDAHLDIRSRTYVLSGNGTYGQFIPAVRLDYPATSGSVLIQLTQNQDYRTNVGVVNTEGTRLDVSIAFFDADGTLLGSKRLNVGPFGHEQIDEPIADLTGDPLEDGHAVVSVRPAAGIRQIIGKATDDPKPPLGPFDVPYVAYASTVDNATGDPVFMLPSIGSRDPLWIPAVAHVEGRRGTVWRSDLEVCSVLGEEARYRVELLETGRDNSDPRSKTFTLGPGVCARYRDVVLDVFDESTTGAIRVVPEMGMVRASSRTHTRRTDGGTYGQFIAALHDAAVTPHPRVASLIGLVESAAGNRGYRSNVGLVNASPLVNTVHLEITTHDRTLLDRVTLELQPYEHRQLNRPLRELAEGDLENARIEIRTSTDDAIFIAYGSVVDNVTGDAVYIPSR